MAGLTGRMSTAMKAKVSKLLDRAEDPAETLDYSYQKQVEQLQNVKKGIADVVTAKKRLQMQEATLKQNVVKLDKQGYVIVLGARPTRLTTLGRAPVQRLSQHSKPRAPFRYVTPHTPHYKQQQHHRADPSHTSPLPKAQVALKLALFCSPCIPSATTRTTARALWPPTIPPPHSSTTKATTTAPSVLSLREIIGSVTYGSRSNTPGYEKKHRLGLRDSIPQRGSNCSCPTRSASCSGRPA